MDCLIPTTPALAQVRSKLHKSRKAKLYEQVTVYTFSCTAVGSRLTYKKIFVLSLCITFWGTYVKFEPTSIFSL